MPIDLSTFKQGVKYKRVTRTLWQSVYDGLWFKFEGSEFKFEDALEMIYPEKTFAGNEIKFASKLLNKLEDQACLIRTRAEYDRRVSVYRLLNPEKITKAWAVYRKWQTSEEPDILRIVDYAGKLTGWNYMYVKDSAVWFWSRHYRSTEVFHLSVPGRDTDCWVALFKLFGYPLILDGKFVHESKAKRQAVHIHADFESRKDQTGGMYEHYQPVYFTIAECFSDNDALGALAVLIRNREKIGWEGLIAAAEDYGVINRLGFSMDAVNLGSGREIFGRDAVEKAEAHKKPRVEKMGVTAGVGPCMNEAYAGLERKWNVECRDVSGIEKAVRDLV